METFNVPSPLNVTNSDLWHGAWGPVTATLDWCEANYQFSHYIAEMANTFSNVVSIAFAVHAARHTVKESLPSRYLAGCLGFALVGLGSFAFHATLLYEAQLADELPMIYLATYSTFMMFDTGPGFTLWSRRAFLLGSLATGFAAFFTWSYSVYRNPVYHQAVFASLVFAVTFRTMYLLHWSEHSSRIPLATRAKIGNMFSAGVGFFALGFFIWNLDNIFCGVLTKWKVDFGWPLAFLLEGHSWWHVLTGLGTYLMLMGKTYWTLCIKDDPSRYGVEHSMGLPHIIRLPNEKQY
ncbi:hypothetical protein JAAARDRAFT_29256 [Jaapia argillacea MUCL 33604]|uniref:Alkaline phytoceramidase n=1 Tax=Jaapia argillacea MUCL 33604 TaxID=933084 RepID=A0A067QKT4_9AGAM|nr:hypothetical protein JAAARDRAFT_29256 [Jaapia argillacea MUCL 33604]